MSSRDNRDPRTEAKRLDVYFAKRNGKPYVILGDERWDLPLKVTSNCEGGTVIIDGQDPRYIAKWFDRRFKISPCLPSGERNIYQLKYKKSTFDEAGCLIKPGKPLKKSYQPVVAKALKFECGIPRNPRPSDTWTNQSLADSYSSSQTQLEVAFPDLVGEDGGYKLLRMYYAKTINSGIKPDLIDDLISYIIRSKTNSYL